jgi:hypothetical protein
MSDEVKPIPNEASTHDAQLIAEQIVSGEQRAPNVDFDADYAKAQEFSGSDIDTSETAADISPQLEFTQLEETTIEAQPTGNPEDYLEMAKDVLTSREEAVTNVSDDLVQQALEKGKPSSK